MNLPPERKIRAESFEKMFDSYKFLTSMKYPPVLTRFLSFLRCLYLGDNDVWCEAISRYKKQ